MLSHFRITAKIGEGGMGEVWRAEDTRLGREVAVKVLPEAFVADPERLARFQREARTLASLSHPNIAAIYEVGEAQLEGGAGEGDAGAPGGAATTDPGLGWRRGTVHFLVMELAAGETLAGRIARGALPLEGALRIALGVAEALEAAHERGVVHRDLKPANVMVDPEGRVKVLDFGLARALEGEPGPSSATALARSPTLTIGATQAGTLLGTAAYMSPEQAAGRPADRRSDVWAFGVVLLEMLTGRAVFTGETVSHTLASVLKDEPEWQSLAGRAPPRILELLERCLRKDPRKRLQSIADARVILEEQLGEPAATTLERATAATPRTPLLGRALPWSLLALALLALAAVLAAPGWLRLRETPSEPMRFALALPAGHSLALDAQDDILAISRDGRRQVLIVQDESATRRLLLRELGQAEGRLLPGTEDASTPFFSPDGEWVAFFAGNRLLKVPVTGGAAVVIATTADDNRGATWSPDGVIYAAPGTALGLHKVRDSGGRFEPVTELDAARRERTHRWPHVLPDGSAVLFTSDTIDTTEYYDDARIEAVRTATGERKVVLEQSSRARYLTNGQLVFARGGALYAAPFDARRLEVTGRPVQVLQGVATTVASGAAHFAAAENGTLLHAPGEIIESAVPHWVDRQGRSELTEIPGATLSQMALSPDGRSVALVASSGQLSDVWIFDLARGASSRLTFEGASEPLWSPDGVWVYYTRGSGGPGGGGGDLFRRRADGSAEPESVWESEDSLNPMSVSPDGRHLVVERSSPLTGPADIWVLPLAGGEPWPFLQGPFSAFMAELSPDGRWLAFVSNESGRPEVYVRPFPGPGGRWQVSNRSGFEPRWSARGDELFFRTGTGTLYSVGVEGGSGLSLGQPQRLFAGIRTGTNPRTYSVAPDASRFLTLSLNPGGDVDRVHLTLGWQEEVARLTAPTGRR